MEVDWKADPGPLRQLIDEIRATNPAAMPQIAPLWLDCALDERDVAAAREALLASDEDPVWCRRRSFPASFRGRRYRPNGKRRAKGAIGFYCCARGAGENGSGSTRLRPGLMRAWTDRCRFGTERGRLTRRAARGRAASRGKGLNQWSPHDRKFGNDCCVGR